MSYRNLSTGFKGKNQTSPTKLSYSRHKIHGLGKNTLIEGSAIDVTTGGGGHISRHSDNKLSKKIFHNDTTSQPKEEHWKEKYFLLQKTIKSLRNEIAEKDKNLTNIQSEYKKLKENYTKEKQNLQVTVKKLQKEVIALKEDLKSKEKEHKIKNGKLEETVLSLHEEIKSLKSLHTSTLTTIKDLHGKELHLLKDNLECEKTKIEQDTKSIIKNKDIIIRNLKAKLANSFQENSKERQNQIDELLKELNRVSIEAEYVKSALKNLKTHNKECQKCSLYEIKFKELTNNLQEKNNQCIQLFSICSKMEKQLSKQDDLLILWKEVKKNS